MHWKTKALIQKALWRMPGNVHVNTMIARLKSGHDSARDLFEKHAPLYFLHLDILREAGLLKTMPPSILEIGTGWDLNVALLMSFSGAETVTTVDKFRHMRFQHACRSLPHFESLLQQIAEKTGRTESDVQRDWKASSSAESLEDLSRCARIRYIAPISSNYHEIEDESVDLCYSTAVFEHISPEGIREILTSTRKKLRPGGLSTHIIDLKDHFAYSHSGLPYNNFLRMSRKQWNWWADNPMSYLNRMSPADWQKMFHNTGYEFAVYQEIREKILTSIAPEELHPEQTTWNRENLGIGELRIVARKI